MLRWLLATLVAVVVCFPGLGRAAEPVAASVVAAAPLPPTPDIEIWLAEGVGRYGDFEFAILGGRPGYPTPTGAFQVEWKSRSWWSKQWNAEMPYASFFSGGAAIHEGSLSTPSHGCIHVSGSAARRIFLTAKEKGTRVFVYP